MGLRSLRYQDVEILLDSGSTPDKYNKPKADWDVEATEKGRLTTRRTSSDVELPQSGEDVTSTPHILIMAVDSVITKNKRVRVDGTTYRVENVRPIPRRRKIHHKECDLILIT